jgi:Fungal potassium channel
MFQVLSARMKNLEDFHSRSCWTPLSYAILWIHLFISVAIYAVDIFTAINLNTCIFFKISSDFDPDTSLDPGISQWLLVTCIIISFIFLVCRCLRTIRVIKSGSVVESYLDPLAVLVQSIRPGQQGRGWKRFLVYAELTKSKKGADYVALFSYFSFEGEHCVSALRILSMAYGANCHKAWSCIIFADGPCRVVNAMNLYAVTRWSFLRYESPFEFVTRPNGTSAIAQFFLNIQAIAEKDNHQVLILFGILFTETIWVVAALNLLLSVALYLLFLFHYIPSEDVTLKRYCRRKINARLECIVRKTLETGVALQDRRPCQADDLGGATTEDSNPSLVGESSDTPPPLANEGRDAASTALTTWVLGL